MTSKAITVLGAGAWGTALATVLSENGHQVTLWTRDAHQAEKMRQTHHNEHYLKDFTLPANIEVTSDLGQAVEVSDVFLFVVPTKAIRQVSGEVLDHLKNRDSQREKPLIIHAAKGLEQGTHLRVSQIIEEVFERFSYEGVVALSGPSHAEEVIRHDITAITAAASEVTAARKVQDLFNNRYFRVYRNDDIIGVELGGALKNIIALCSGACAGIGLGDNAEAALMTRGLAEISRLGVAMGANPLTFSGLSGVGDLIVTCTSKYSRNYRAGYQIAQGESVEDVVNNMGQVVEGINTTTSAYELAQEYHVDMPITTAVYHVIYEGSSVKDEIRALMDREAKSEIQKDQAMAIIERREDQEEK